MADGVELDPGTGGAIVATDDAGAAGHVQIIKLAISADGSATAIPADGTNGLDVDVTRLPALAAGTNNIGDVDVLTVPADPFGANADAAATAGSTGSIQAKLRLMTSQLDSIKTAVETLDNAISGSEMQVDVLTMPSTAVTNAGTFAVQESGAALTALQLIDDTVIADDAAFTVGTTKVNVVGFLADQASTDSVNEGDVGAARMTLDRKQIATVAPSADTEGWDVSNNIDIDETEDAVKASAGKLGGWFLYNDGALEVYVKFYNDTTANVTVGSTTPFMTIPIPAGAASNIEFVNGIAFSAAITVAATTGVATADTGAPATNQVAGFILYK